MKKSIILFAALLLTVTAFAQSPQKMSYQSVIRDATDDLVTESTVGIKISILQGTSDGASVYTEKHSTITNINGLVSLELGTGLSLTGIFADIDWGNGPYFIKSETDPEGGTTYTLSGVSELLSVPFALFASEAGNATFTTTDSVTSNALGDYATDDFVFGSPVLEDDDSNTHAARMFFDKSKAAFRAGVTTIDAWDEENVGYSSIAMGSSTVASGPSSTATGFNTIASGSYSVAMGIGAEASGYISTAIGGTTTASGTGSTALGIWTSAPSYIETTVGGYNTLYTPQNATIWNSQDRLFVIGNGQSTGTRSDAMVVLKNGNVGIGTSSPTRRLTVAGYNNSIATSVQSTSGVMAGFYMSSGSAYLQTHTNHPLHLTTNDQNAQVTLTQDGNMGIGTQSPNEGLEIAGDGRAFFGDGGGSNRTGLLIDGTWQSHATRIESYDYGTGQGLDLVINEVGNGNVGIRVQDPNVSLDVFGSIEYTGTITDVSDERLKENFESIEHPLESISQLQGYSYNMIDDEEMIREYGVIAQEIQKVFPELVTVVDEENGYLGVSYVQLIPILLEAIKEQQEMMEDLQAENSELKAGNENKAVRLDDHDARLQANTQLLEELNSILKAQSQR